MKDKTNIIIFLSVLSLMYAPTWLVGLLGIIFDNATMIATAVSYAVFWLAPFTPFWTIAIGITFAVRKIVDFIKRRK